MQSAMSDPDKINAFIASRVVDGRHDDPDLGDRIEAGVDAHQADAENRHRDNHLDQCEPTVNLVSIIHGLDLICQQGVQRARLRAFASDPLDFYFHRK